MSGFTSSDADKLASMLRKACPFDTGAMKISIEQTENDFEFKIIIGGSNINKKSKQATSTYATSLNYDTLTKFGNDNRHYHWIENVINEFLNTKGDTKYEL